MKKLPSRWGGTAPWLVAMSQICCSMQIPLHNHTIEGECDLNWVARIKNCHPERGGWRGQLCPLSISLMLFYSDTLA